MNIFSVVATVFFATACGAPKVYSDYATWDRNTDKGIQRSEFVDSYLANNNAKNWQLESGSLNRLKFTERLFHRMDENNSGTLTVDEFNPKIKKFSFGMVSASISSWDTDDNGILVRDEFTAAASKSKLFNLWDTSGDNSISAKELAGGMFYVCDLNNDHHIDENEFKAWQESIN
ncbi:hypothetical protein [Pseudochryseolinea flava]|nr:hypothetical protein [Pseudochryseolinea flava]